MFGCDDTAKSEFLNTRKRQGQARRARPVAVEPVVRRARAARSPRPAARPRRRVAQDDVQGRRARPSRSCSPASSSAGPPGARVRFGGEVQLRSRSHGDGRWRRYAPYPCRRGATHRSSSALTSAARGSGCALIATAAARRRSSSIRTPTGAPPRRRRSSTACPRRGSRGEVSLLWARDGERRTLLHSSATACANWTGTST